MTATEREQIASGTTGVESLHRELNRKTANAYQMADQSTIFMDCAAYSFLKLMVHNCGEYSPAPTAVRQNAYIGHNLSCWSLTEAEWSTVLDCDQTPWSDLRARNSFRILSKKQSVCLKRPASWIKRHTFNKRRKALHSVHKHEAVRSSAS